MVFIIIENLDLVTAQFYATIHTKHSPKDGAVFLEYANMDDKVDD